MKKICQNINCQKEFDAKKEETKYCSRSCHYSDPNKKKPSEETLKKRGESISNSIARKGGVWNKGLTAKTNESLKKIGEATKLRTPWNKSEIEFVTKICENCKKEFTIKWSLRHHRFCSQICANVVREGKNNTNWNPNRDEVGGAYTEKFFDKNFREKILQEQLNVCPVCFSNRYQKNRFDLHHIDHNKKNDNRENLIYLCINCHNTERHHQEKYKEILTKINQFIIEENKKTDADFIQHLKELSESLKMF